jgi:hypothetical protein
MNMQATMTHFAIILPDWNSLESVRRAHSDLEAAALVFFALLVVSEALAHLSDDKKTERRFDRISVVFFAIAVLAEIAAYPYGQRNDTLSAETIGSLSEKAKEALTDSGTALTNSGIALTRSGEAATKADVANDAAGKAQKKASDALGTSKTANDVAGSAKEKADAVAKLADEANKKAEAARLIASRMQDAIRPRVAGTNGGQNDELELFAWTKAAIVFSTEAEPRDLTANIIGILQRARWNVLSAAPNSPLLADPQPAKILGGKNVTIVPMAGGGLRDGVFVVARTDGPPQPSVEAARLLCYVLKDNHVECETWWPAIYQASHWPKDVPLDAVLILVGRKPMAYLKWADNPDAQDAFTRMEKEHETMSEDEKRDRSNILERRREFLRQRTPKPN